MKLPCILLAALLLPLCAAPAADYDWRADLSTTEVHNVPLRHGDSATLRAHLYLRGAPYAPTNAVCHYRVSLDSADWLQAPCAIASNTVSMAWTPLLDSGSDVVPLVFRLDGDVYRAAAMLYLRPSPGPDPSEDRALLDFDAFTVTNAPWALPSDLPALPLSVADGGTGADSAAGARANLGAASVADATLTEAGEWVFADGLLAAAQANMPFVAPPSHLELRQETFGVACWIVSDDGTAQADFCSVTISADGLTATMASGMSWAEDIVPVGSAVATRTVVSGYRLGSQADRPLAKATDLAAHLADTTNHVTASDRAAWNAKQAAIPDLETIRSGAASGATAVQTNALAAAAIAATNYTDSAVLHTAPEYIVARETDRRAAYTAASRDDALRDGKLILLYMAAQPSAAWTLNLTLADGSTTGAKPVRFWGTTTVTTHYAAGSILPLVYRAGAWYISDRDSNSDTYDRVRVSSYVRFSAQTTKYAICCGTTNGYRKVEPGVVFDVSMPILYANVNATSAAGAQNNNFYAAMPNIDVRNTVAGFASRRGKPLYLVGSLAADGRTFTVGNPAFSYDPTPPCLLLGLFNNNADNQLYFLPGPVLDDPAAAVSDAMAAAVADNPVEPTLEVLRAAVADLWERVDGIDGVDAADAIADLQLAIAGLDDRLSALETGQAALSAVVTMFRQTLAVESPAAERSAPTNTPVRATASVPE